MIEVVDEFFSTDDFAQSVEFQVTSGSSTNTFINVIYDTTYAVDEMRGGTGYQNALPQVVCKTRDVVGASTRSCVILNNTTYSVREVQDDGTGITILTLSKDNING